MAWIYQDAASDPVCLDRVIPLGERHLRHLIDEYTAHYHLERPHQGLSALRRGRPL